MVLEFAEIVDSTSLIINLRKLKFYSIYKVLKWDPW